MLGMELPRVSVQSLLVVLATAALTAALIYLTPLKWISIIEPTVHDIPATDFYTDFSEHPDNYVFIDVRPEAVYNQSHAKGSISMPLHTLYDFRHTLPKSGKEIILICSGGRASGVGYSYLQHYGFFNIHRIAGGIESWTESSLPLEGTQVPAL